MAISIYKCTEELQNQIITAYKNNISLRQIEKDFDVSRKTISKFSTGNKEPVLIYSNKSENLYYIINENRQ